MSGLSMDDVVALNALIVTALGLSFVIGRGSRRDRGRLNLTGPKRPTALDEYAKAHKSMVKADPAKAGASAKTGGYGAAALKRLEQEEARENERQLNVFFNWNGHTWDAYEVLGLPAGAAREKVIEAFHAQRAKSPDSTPFLQAAADAITKR